MFYCFGDTGYIFYELIQSQIQNNSNQAIEWSAIMPRWHHHKRFHNILAEEQILYLYENFDSIYNKIDKNNNKNFSHSSISVEDVFASLMKDKNGYRHLQGSEQLKRAFTIIEIYTRFLEKIKPDFIIFPDLEVVDGFLLLSICKALQIEPIYYVSMRTFGGCFFSDDCYEKLPKYFGHYTNNNISQAKDFIQSFVKEQPLTFSQTKASDSSKSGIKRNNFISRALISTYMHFKYETKYTGEDNFRERVKSNFRTIIYKFRQIRYNLIHKKYFKSSKSPFNFDINYGLYALQYTPESSINGLEPYYIDQLRAIDLLLLNMPPNMFLVVKEHPAMKGIRRSSFYKNLLKRPGLLLASPDSDTKRLLKSSKFVATITGTIGLESYLLDKPCLMFGKCFLNHLTIKVEQINLKELISNAVNHYTAPTEDTKIIEIAKLYNIRYEFEFGDVWSSKNTLSSSNITALYASLVDHIQKIKGKNL